MGRAEPGRGGRGSGAVWLLAGVVGGAVVALALVTLGFKVVGPGAPPEPLGPPHYVEEAAAAGITHVYDGGFEFFVGGGVASFDCDGDRKPDLYFAGGSTPAALYRNESPVGGALRFTQVPDPATDLTSVVGAYPVDIDSDGVTDLAVLRYGENVLLRGLGDCRFERANEAWGLDGGDAWTAAFSATWEGSTSWPTLAFGNYLDPVQADHRTTCADSVLVRPSGDSGTYANQTALTPGWCTLSILFSDWNRSGRRDLRMTNDRHYYTDGEDQLWRVDPGEPPRLYTEADGWQRMEIWGMGIASYDLTGDGLPEVFLTSQGDNKLQTLALGPSQPNYEDIAIRRGVTAHRPYMGGDVLPSTAWHTEFQDVNNDGFIDLFVSKGNVDAQPDAALRDPDNLLLGRPDGTFIESARAAGIAEYVRGRGAAVVDLNLDGLLDLVQVNRRVNVSLWRNVGSGQAADPASMGNWLALDVEQPGPNPDAIGAWVEVRAGDQVAQRELTVGGGHAGGQLGWVHFGLGDADRAQVRVQWPDGEIGPWMDVDADSFAILERGASVVRTWVPSQG